MNWQLIAVIVIVAAAAVYIGRQTWRTWSTRKDSSCGGGCGCASKTQASGNTNGAPVLIPSEELVLRRRDRGPL